jgi:penicillin-binding protein 1A
VGNDDNSPTRKVTGGLIPAEIWHDVMQFAHNGLVPRPLPGTNLPAQQPTTISQVEPQDSGTMTPPQTRPQKQKRGFFESLFGGDSAQQPETQPPPKKKLTAAERARRAREDK